MDLPKVDLENLQNVITAIQTCPSPRSKTRSAPEIVKVKNKIWVTVECWQECLAFYNSKYDYYNKHPNLASMIRLEEWFRNITEPKPLARLKVETKLWFERERFKIQNGYSTYAPINYRRTLQEHLPDYQDWAKSYAKDLPKR